jgi:RNA polymerase sigma factor (TIGR02999 family)
MTVGRPCDVECGNLIFRPAVNERVVGWDGERFETEESRAALAGTWSPTIGSAAWPVGIYSPRMSELTRLIEAAARGDRQAAAELLPLVYDELRRLAGAKVANEAPGQTLSPTALVHEAYLRLVGRQEFDGRGHFFAAAATAMRRILVERARHKNREIHGGGFRRRELHPDLAAAPEPDDRLLALDAALKKLAALDPMKARLVELRYFAGLTGEQAAEILGVSPTTADRHWIFARAWLRREIQAG